MSTTDPIPRRNSKRFNWTVSFIAAILFAVLLVSAKPYYDAYRAKKAEAAQTSSETDWKSTPQEVHQGFQAQPSQLKVEKPKSTSDTTLTVPLTNQSRAKEHDKVSEQSNPTQESSDPWANLKLDKKGATK